MPKFRRVLRPASFAAWLLASALAPAQDPGRPWGFLSPRGDLTEKFDAAPPVDLRSNVAQSVYLYLVNPTEDTPEVKALVRSGPQTIGQIPSVRLPAKGFQKFALTELAPAAKSPNGLPLATEANTADITFRVSVSSATKRDDPANDAVQVVNLRSPATLLGETVATFAGGINQLSVALKANNLTGPPLPVELVLSPDDIPGLSKGELKGITRGTLTADQPAATLVAGGLTIAAGATGDGRASLTVDGVERALVLKGNFRVQAGATSSPFTIDTRREVRVRAPKYARPGDPVAVKIETLNAADASRVTLSVSPGLGGGQPTQSFSRTGPRERKASVIAGEDGTLSVVTSVKDWTFQPDTKGLYGPVTLRATMTGDGETRESTAVVVFDESPPKDVKFLPAEAKKFPVRGRPFNVRAVGADNESEIARVDFFLGAEPPAPGPDGKLPAEPKPVPGKFDAKARHWAAELSLPEKKGTVPIFVRFTNGVGLTTTERLDLNVIDPLPGSIKGQVTYGDRPQKVDVAVWLLSKDGKTIVKDGKVDAEGYFKFTDIPPGDYVLVSEQKTSGKPLTGVAPVTVKEGPDPLEVKITLKQKQ